MSCYIMLSVNRVDKTRQDKNDVENEKTAKIVIKMEKLNLKHAAKVTAKLKLKHTAKVTAKLKLKHTAKVTAKLKLKHTASSSEADSEAYPQ